MSSNNPKDDYVGMHEAALRRERKLRDEINLMRRELTWVCNQRNRLATLRKQAEQKGIQ